MEERIKTTITEGVADVRLARADKMNALDDAMFTALLETGEKLKADKSVRAVVISGEGRAFCAGLDMGNFGRMASGDKNEAGKSNVTGRLGQRTHGIANRAQYAALVWRDIPVPVIAAVHGVAFGGGFQVALGADMRFVAPGTRFSVMEIKWGLVPDMAEHVSDAGPRARGRHSRPHLYRPHLRDRRGAGTRLCHPHLQRPYAEALTVAREIADKSLVGDPRGQAHSQRCAGRRCRCDPARRMPSNRTSRSAARTRKKPSWPISKSAA